VSGAGKTTVAEELERRGRQVIHGDRELAYLGDPDTGEALEGLDAEQLTDPVRWRHERWIWDVDRVKALVADRSHAQAFFCGGSRNHGQFLHLFDGVFVLEIDIETLDQRLAARPDDEFGGKPEERRLIARVHASKEDLPKIAITIDATAPLNRVVDEILLRCAETERGAG
jgi:thymidylate kinase